MEQLSLLEMETPKSWHRPATIRRGAIVWLPAGPAANTALLRLPARILNHPVLIYNIPNPEQVVVLPLTSFQNGESVSGRFQNDADFRARQIPITPAPKHPDNGVLLTLAEGRVWARQSYISISQFRVPCQVLREEADGPWSLSPESLQALDDVVATFEGLKIWGMAEQGDAVEPGKDEEAVEDDEEWTVVISKKTKRAMSMSTNKPSK